MRENQSEGPIAPSATIAPPTAAPAPIPITRFRLPIATAAGAALVALSTAIQLWPMPFLTGLALAILAVRRRARIAVVCATAATAVGWALPLIYRGAAGEPVLGTARVTAGLAGLPAIGWLAILITLLVAVLQALVAVWVTRTISALRGGSPTINPPSKHRAPS